MNYSKYNFILFVILSFVVLSQSVLITKLQKQIDKSDELLISISKYIVSLKEKETINDYIYPDTILYTIGDNLNVNIRKNFSRNNICYEERRYAD